MLWELTRDLTGWPEWLLEHCYAAVGDYLFMGDRIAVMRTGRLAQIGTFDELYYSPANLFVATLIGTPPLNVLSAEVRDGMLLVGNASFALPDELKEKLPAERVRLGVRSEGWVVNQAPAESGCVLSISRVERLFTERAAFAGGQVAGESVNVLVPLDFPDAVKQISLQPDWMQVYFFAADSETALHTPGVPELF